MEDRNDNPLLLIIAWLNYLISHIFTIDFLNKFALILSIIGSIVYIYTTIIKLKNKQT